MEVILTIIEVTLAQVILVLCSLIFPVSIKIFIHLIKNSESITFYIEDLTKICCINYLALNFMFIYFNSIPIVVLH